MLIQRGPGILPAASKPPQMNSRPWINPSLVLAALASAAGLVIFFTRDQTDQTDQTNQAIPAYLPQTRKPRAAPDFWDAARVPDPGHDAPVTAIRPEDLGVFPPATPVDHPSRIARAISGSDLPAIQSAALSWFEQDPVAARAWLASQPTLEDLQPAISYIASRISEQGDLKTALEWTALLSAGTLRDDTIFNLLALALREGRITVTELPLDRIPPDRHAELLSGAAGD